MGEIEGSTTLGVEDRRGHKWAHGRPLNTGITTILPPNSAICVTTFARTFGALAPSSRHQGGVHILMADGAVVFITDSIEASDSSAKPVHVDSVAPDAVPGSVSPFGLYGALGTRASRETIDEDF